MLVSFNLATSFFQKYQNLNQIYLNNTGSSQTYITKQDGIIIAYHRNIHELIAAMDYASTGGFSHLSCNIAHYRSAEMAANI